MERGPVPARKRNLGGHSCKATPSARSTRPSQLVGNLLAADAGERLATLRIPLVLQ